MTAQPPSAHRLLLEKALARAEADDYIGAFAALNEARKSGLENLYVAAIEHQVESLAELARRGESTEESRADILEPVEGLIERALADEPGVSGIPPQGPVQSPSIDQMKIRCFQAAGAHFTQGDYDRALAEIGRIFLIDPDDRIAREYESKLRELISLHAPRAIEPAETPHERTPVGTTPPDVDQIPVEKHPRFNRKNVFLVSLSVILLLIIGAMALFPPVDADDTAQSAGTITQANGSHGTEVRKDEAREPPVSTPAHSDSERSNALLLPLSLAAKEEPSDSMSQNPEGTSPTNSIVSPADSERESTLQPAGRTSAEPSQGPATTPPTNSGEPHPSLTPLSEGQPDPEPFIPVEQEPQILKMERPQFPEKIWQLGVEGEVIARVFVDEDGNPVKIRILKSSNSMLDVPVTEAIMKWKFSPATMSKGPIAAWVTIPLKFKKNN